MAKEIMFLKLGSFIEILANNSVVEVGKWFPISTNFVIKKKDNKYYGEPLDNVTYKSREDGIESNEAILQVNFPPSKTTSPSSYNLSETILNNTKINIGEKIIINAAVDRIRILSFDSNIGILTFKGNRILPGTEIKSVEKNQLEFESKNGIGNPYQRIVFNVGNAEKTSVNYNFDLSILGKCVIENPVINEKVPEEIKASAYIKITNGVVKGLLKYQVTLQTQSTDIFNYGSVIVDDIELSKVGLHTDTIQFNEDGEAIVNFYVSSSKVLTDGSLYFDFQMIDIDGKTTYIDTKKVQLILTV